MPRRRSPEKRKVLPDPKYKDVVLAKFMAREPWHWPAVDLRADDLSDHGPGSWVRR